MPVTIRFRLKYKRLARQRIQSCVRHMERILTYDDEHLGMELLDVTTRANMEQVLTHLRAQLILKVLT